MDIPPVTENEGFEGTLFDPNWPEVRGIFRGLWFWSDEMVAYWENELKWRREVEPQIKASMSREARQALGWE
jgi:hypothetical protein